MKLAQVIQFCLFTFLAVIAWLALVAGVPYAATMVPTTGVGTVFGGLAVVVLFFVAAGILGFFAEKIESLKNQSKQISLAK